MRLSEIISQHNRSTKRQRGSSQVSLCPAKNLTRLVQDSTKEGRLRHINYLEWSRAFLSKSRYMYGRQCPKRLWQAVYDPKSVEEPLPGTTKGMGIEVGIKARLYGLEASLSPIPNIAIMMWPSGVRTR